MSWGDRVVQGRIGIMGGTFDPIHYGHLVAAEQARVSFDLSKVIFVPTGQPPHKKEYPVSHPEHRYAMVLLATCSNPHFEVSRAEIDRPGPSYTIDTLHLFRQALGEGSQLHFITGADAVLEILTWKDPQELVHFCEFIAVTRPGYHLKELSRRLGPELLAHLHPLTVPGIEISSTELRERVRRGWPIKYLTPPQIESYIEKYRLYREDAVEAPGPEFERELVSLGYPTQKGGDQ